MICTLVNDLFQAEVVSSQSTESMSFALSMLSFLCTLSWSLYGYLIGDVYVVVSEGVSSGESARKYGLEINLDTLYSISLQ